MYSWFLRNGKYSFWFKFDRKIKTSNKFDLDLWKNKSLLNDSINIWIKAILLFELVPFSRSLFIIYQYFRLSVRISRFNYVLIIKMKKETSNRAKLNGKSIEWHSMNWIKSQSIRTIEKNTHIFHPGENVNQIGSFLFK